MIFKSDSGIVIDGGSIFKAIILVDVLFHIHKALIVAEEKRKNQIEYELKSMKKEQKLSKKKAKKEQKAESK